MDKIKADPLAVNAIMRAVLRGTGTTPADFRRATLVDGFSMVYHKFPDWTEAAPGDFSVLGELENMHTLHFPNRPGGPVIQVDDFSFLARCKKLKRLDVACTNFTDCSILPQLPPLDYVRLPEKSKLTHLEALEQLPKRTKVSFLAPPAPQTPPDPAPAAVKPREKPEGSEKVKAIVEELKKRTALDCYTLTIQPDVQPGLFDSKFGGFPYWDLSLPYPTDPAGEKLVLLAQINFDQYPMDEPLPQGGMLQFFIGRDDVCGVDFDAPDEQAGFRVVYHATVDRSVTVEQLKPLGIPTHKDVEEFFPVFREAAVTAEKTVCYMSADDRRFDGLFARAVKKLTGEDTGGQSAFQYLDKPDFEYLYDQFYSCGHRLLGYPYFTQYDPRPADSPYDTLLFQIDSDGARKSDYVLWGDCGVANFFINREDLKRRDFSRVFYTWDCC